MKPSLFKIVSITKVHAPWATDGHASLVKCEAVPITTPLMFEGQECDLNERTWGLINIDWRLMYNRCATTIGVGIWVVSGWDAKTGEAAVFVVEKLLPGEGEDK